MNKLWTFTKESRAELRKVAEEGPRVSRPEPELAAHVLEDAPEAVPLRLVLPVLARRELADELGFHGREGDQMVELRRALDCFTARESATRAGHDLNLPRGSEPQRG